MASAQVLTNSASAARKQGHLEAGKRRLEEFRKKKAEGRAKKGESSGQTQSADAGQKEQSAQEGEAENFFVSNGASFQRDVGSNNEPSTSVVAHSDAVDSYESTKLNSLSSRDANASVASSKFDTSFGDSIQQKSETWESRESDVSGFSAPGHVYNNHVKKAMKGGVRFSRSDNELSNKDETGTNSLYSSIDSRGSIHQTNVYFPSKNQLEGNMNAVLDSSLIGHSYSSSPFTNTLTEKSSSIPFDAKFAFLSSSTSQDMSSANEDLTQLSLSMKASSQTDSATKIENWKSVTEEKKLISTSNHIETTPWRMPGSFSSSPGMNAQSASYHIPSFVSDYGAGRSRPPFMDSIKAPSASAFSVNDRDKTETSNSFISPKVDTFGVNPSPVSQQSFVESGTQEPHFNSSSADYSSMNVLPSSSFPLKDDHFLMKQEFPAPSKDEDFAALEQHIDDLTQEKFSLQRALEASRALADSLASENSSLTDSYNQQGTVVNQLKFDMERLQEEIRNHLVALEAVKNEYANAQLECSAADERAKILASEVIGLEEKALRMRSNELKLERDLEKSHAQAESYKKKISSLEKERRDLQSTIDALKEEKKLLQAKIRKASASGVIIDASKTTTMTKDESTSTEDLGDEISDLAVVEIGGQNASSSNTVNKNESSVVPSSSTSRLNLAPEIRDSHMPESSSVIPPDQLRIISNINSLISELVSEKEELQRALALESSNSSKLKDLNKELSQKLEAQTQRLELLTAQRMANENIQIKATDSQSVFDHPVYADEGDEVVERVLGWIMKLFPGGPARRRTSKLL